MANWEDAPSVNGGWEDAPEDKDGLLTKGVKAVLGGAETLSSVVTGGAGQIVGGLAGIPVAIAQGPEAGAETVRKVGDFLHDKPVTDAGKKYDAAVSGLFEKVIDKATPIAVDQVKHIPFIGGQITDDQAEALGRGAMEIGANFIPAEIGIKAVKGKLKGERPNVDTASKLEDVKASTGWEDAPATSAHADDFNVHNPYDLGGHVTALEEGRPTTLDNPQGELFGGREEGAITQPKIEDINPDALLNDQHKQNTIPFDVGLAEHPTPEAPHPTDGVDFPLKTETIDSDPVIRNLREAIAAQEAQVAHMEERGAMRPAIERVQKSLDEMKTKFQDYMDQGYGVEKAQDAYPGIFEHGGETKLPIKQTYTPGGVSKVGSALGKQKGAIDPALLTAGVSKLIDFAKERFPEDGGKRILNKFIGTFNKGEIGRAIVASVDPKSREHLVWMTPDEFLRAAKKRMSHLPESAFEQKREGIRAGLKTEKGLNELPMLRVEGGSVVAHEGRHRMDVFKEQGLDKVPVRLIDSVHTNERGALPYKELVSENGGKIPVPERVQGLGQPKPTDSLMDRIAKQNQVSASLSGFNRQAGAIDPAAIRDGLKGIGNKLAERFSKGQKQAQPTVFNDPIKALKESAVGKGVGDFTRMDLKSPQEIVEASKNYEDIKRAPIQENIENGGLFRGLATKHPVVKYTTERLNRAQQEAHAAIREFLTDNKTGLKTFMRKLDPTSKGEIWSRMMMDEGQKMRTPEELKAMGFSEHQIAMYDKFRQVDNMFYQKFNEARQALGMKPIDQRIAHVAGRFTGDFYQMAYRAKLDKAGNPVLDAHGQPVRDPVGRIPGNTSRELAKAVEFMKEKHPDWEFGKPEYKRIGKGNATGDRFSGFMEVLNMVGDDNPHMAELLDSYKEFMKSDATNYLNALRHAKDKKAQAGGIAGSEGNKEWKSTVQNAEEGMKAQLSYLEQGFNWLEMQKAVEDIKQVTGNEEVVSRHPNAVAWAAAHTDQALGHNQGWVADVANNLLSDIGQTTGVGHTNLIKGSNAVKHVMMQKFMGFANIPFTATQLMQPLTSMPAMAALMKTRGLEFSAAKAGMEATSSMMKFLYQETPLHEVFGKDKRTDFEKAAWDYAHKNGVFDVQMVDHTRDINASPLKEGFDAVADANIKYPELATRGTAFMFYAHALKETGMPTRDVLTTAENMTRMTMADYTPGARPAMYGKMGFIGDLASTLARYKHNQVNQLTFYGREAMEGLKRGDLKPSAPLATFLGTMLAVNGIVGMIGYNTADTVYRLFSEHILQKPDSITDMVMRNPDIPEAVSHGMFASLGVDMTSRFSNAKVLPESTGEFLLPFGSGLADVFGANWNLATNFNEFNGKRWLKAMAPSSMTGLLENQLFSVDNGDGTSGYINPRTMDRNYNRDERNRSLRNFGFRDMRESREMTQNFEFKQREKAEKDLRGKVLDNAMQDWVSGNWSADKAQKYSKKYMELGSDQFARDLTQQIQAYHITDRDRIVLRNAGGSYSGATNLKQLFDNGYKK